MHKGLVEKNARKEVKLLITHTAGLVVFVQDKGNPLRGLVAIVGPEDVVFEGFEGLGGVSEGNVEFLV